MENQESKYEVEFAPDMTVTIPMYRFEELIAIEALWERAALIAECSPADRFMSDVEKVLVMLLYPDDAHRAHNDQQDDEYVGRHAAPEDDDE